MKRHPAIKWQRRAVTGIYCAMAISGAAVAVNIGMAIVDWMDMRWFFGFYAIVFTVVFAMQNFFRTTLVEDLRNYERQFG